MLGPVFLISLLGAIPVMAAQPNPGNELLFMGQLRASGSYLGVRLMDIDADRAKALNLREDRGAEVTKVQPDSPAEKAGIRPGDVLLSYNGENIVGSQQLGRLVLETPPGRKIKIQLWRDGKMQTTAIVTGTPPSSVLALPTDRLRFDMPEPPSSWMPVIPNPMLTWKSSLLGIECEPVDSQLAEYFGVKRGALVRSVAKGSAGEKAGLKAGDVLTAIGGRSIATPRDLTEFLRTECQAGKQVAVVVMRDRKPLTLTVLPSDSQE